MRLLQLRSSIIERSSGFWPQPQFRHQLWESGALHPMTAWDCQWIQIPNPTPCTICKVNVISAADSVDSGQISQSNSKSCRCRCQSQQPVVDVDQDCCCHMVVLLLHFDVLMMDHCHAVVPILANIILLIQIVLVIVLASTAL